MSTLPPPSSNIAAAFLAEWHVFVADRTAETLAPLMAEEVLIRTPLYWKPRGGRLLCATLIAGVANIFEDLTYVRQWVSERDICLEFATKIGDIAVKGVDLITLNDEGLIQELEVMVRPPNALEILRERMDAFVAGQFGPEQ